jgi:hypothetical protein
LGVTERTVIAINRFRLCSPDIVEQIRKDIRAARLEKEQEGSAPRPVRRKRYYNTLFFLVKRSMTAFFAKCEKITA